MFDKLRLKDILVGYKKDFVANRWENEKYKWEAIKCFQDNWNINAENFSEMLHKSLNKTSNLLVSVNNFPRRMIESFSEVAPAEVKSMFINLFDENIDVYQRIKDFKEQSSIMLKKYGYGDAQHYQYENAISVYLWLRFPDKYYIYKYSEVKTVSKKLDSNYDFKKGSYEANIKNFYNLYDEISSELKNDEELVKLLSTQLTDACYNDPELKTLTIDVGFYISRYYNPESSVNIEPDASDKKINYWWLNANPKIWSFSNIDVGEVQDYTLYSNNGNKRKIFQNFISAKAGDEVIGYETTPNKQIVALAKISAEQDGEKLYFEKTEGLSSPIDYQVLRSFPELENMEYFKSPQGSLFKLTKNEYDFIMDIIREENPIVQGESVEIYTKNDFLDEVYMPEERYNSIYSVLKSKKNIILQGAPGVGKTFAAKRLAYSMMGEKDDSRVELVQFHQNYSYEDFVMGYKPVENGFELKYGIFYRFCQKAANQPDKNFFFIIDEINRGNMSKIFGELLMLIEKDYRGTSATLAYNGTSFKVPKNVYIIGMMNTADRSLAMIDYALRRRFSFFNLDPGFDTDGFIKYQKHLNNKTFDLLIQKIKELNNEIILDRSLGRGFCIGHSYFCGQVSCSLEWLSSIIEYDILPTLSEYWFDDEAKLSRWENILYGVLE